MKAQVQAPGGAQSGSPSEICTVELSSIDALGVGLSLQTLARTRPMPDETASIYRRVGEQLEAAARRAVKEVR